MQARVLIGVADVACTWLICQLMFLVSSYKYFIMCKDIGSIQAAELVIGISLL